MSVLDAFRLDGRVAVVTGGNQGLGEAFAHALAEAGARVAVAARDAARSAEVADAIAGAIAVRCAVTRRVVVAAMLAEVPTAWAPSTCSSTTRGRASTAPRSRCPTTSGASSSR